MQILILWVLTFKSCGFEISENNSEINLGEILLRKNIDLLDELVIQVKKAQWSFHSTKEFFN